MDVTGACIGMVLVTLPIVIVLFYVWIKTKEWPIFKQQRVGRYGKLFWIYKIRTIYIAKGNTKLSGFLRNSKLDEVPQLLNVFIGNMSLVGPRPDVVGFADQLQGEDRIILEVKPGITGEASLFFFKEENLLKQQKDKVLYNQEVLWKRKVAMNKEYVKNFTIIKDIKILGKTCKFILKNKFRTKDYC